MKTKKSRGLLPPQTYQEGKSKNLVGSPNGSFRPVPAEITHAVVYLPNQRGYKRGSVAWYINCFADGVVFDDILDWATANPNLNPQGMSVADFTPYVISYVTLLRNEGSVMQEASRFKRSLPISITVLGRDRYLVALSDDQLEQVDRNFGYFLAEPAVDWNKHYTFRRKRNSATVEDQAMADVQSDSSGLAGIFKISLVQLDQEVDPNSESDWDIALLEALSRNPRGLDEDGANDALKRSVACNEDQRLDAIAEGLIRLQDYGWISQIFHQGHDTGLFGLTKEGREQLKLAPRRYTS